jgi:hypothetical protein
MDSYYPTIDKPATPEYVLSVFIDQHRQLSELDDMVDKTAVLTFDTTIAELRAACDLVDWLQVGRALNAQWGFRYSDEEWFFVLEPAKQRTLRGLCEFIARGARRIQIRPLTVLGKPCATAGAFMTIRSLLRDAGANVGEISPSTPLAGYARRYAKTFLGPISRLAPNVIPPVKARAGLWGLHEWCAGLGFLMLLVGLPLVVVGVSWFGWIALIGIVLMIANYPVAWITHRFTLPSSVEFGELKTFGDLARVIAAPNCE